MSYHPSGINRGRWYPEEETSPGPDGLEDFSDLDEYKGSGNWSPAPGEGGPGLTLEGSEAAVGGAAAAGGAAVMIKPAWAPESTIQQRPRNFRPSAPSIQPILHSGAAVIRPNFAPFTNLKGLTIDQRLAQIAAQTAANASSYVPTGPTLVNSRGVRADPGFRWIKPMQGPLAGTGIQVQVPIQQDPVKPSPKLKSTIYLRPRAFNTGGFVNLGSGVDPRVIISSIDDTMAAARRLGGPKYTPGMYSPYSIGTEAANLLRQGMNQVSRNDFPLDPTVDWNTRRILGVAAGPQAQYQAGMAGYAAAQNRMATGNIFVSMAHGFYDPVNPTGVIWGRTYARVMRIYGGIIGMPVNTNYSRTGQTFSQATAQFQGGSTFGSLSPQEAYRQSRAGASARARQGNSFEPSWMKPGGMIPQVQQQKPYGGGLYQDSWTPFVTQVRNKTDKEHKRVRVDAKQKSGSKTLEKETRQRFTGR